MSLLTPEQVANFPVAHLSPSAIRSYLDNPQAFFMRYVRYKFDTRKGPAMVEGDCVHRVLALFWDAVREDKVAAQSFKWEAATIDQINDVLVPDQDKIDFGKTGSFEKSRDTILQAVEFYRNNLPPYMDHEIIAVEEKMVTDFEDLEGNPMPIPLKGYIDLAYLDGEADIVDHKIVSTFTEIDAAGHPVKEDDGAKYDLQAAPYFFLFRKHFGRNPRRMLFDEVKKSKNKDGSAQRQTVVIEFTPKMLNRWLELYKRIVRSLAGLPLIDPETGIMQFLPNPFAQFGGGESWADFCEECDNGVVWTMDSIKEIRASKFLSIDEVDSAF